VELAFSSKKLKRQLTEQRQMARSCGHVMPALARRLSLLRAASVLAEVPHTRPARRHELFGEWSGHFAVDLTGNWRLVFRPDHDPVPRRADGGVDITAVTAVVIVSIIDYHND